MGIRQRGITSFILNSLRVNTGSISLKLAISFISTSIRNSLLCLTRSFLFLYSEELITKKHLTIFFFFFFRWLKKLGLLVFRILKHYPCASIWSMCSWPLVNRVPLPKNSYSARWERFLFIRLCKDLQSRGWGCGWSAEYSSIKGD